MAGRSGQRVEVRACGRGGAGGRSGQRGSEAHTIASQFGGHSAPARSPPPPPPASPPPRPASREGVRAER